MEEEWKKEILFKNDTQTENEQKLTEKEEQMCNNWVRDDLKMVYVEDVNIKDKPYLFKKLLSTIEKYSNNIESIEICNLKVDHADQFSLSLGKCEKLREISFTSSLLTGIGAVHTMRLCNQMKWI